MQGRRSLKPLRFALLRFASLGLVLHVTIPILILVLKEFLILEDSKLDKTKFFIKLKEALILETPLIFNGYVLI